MLLLAGCQPPRPALFDPDALRAGKRIVVLPLADAPGQEAQGSGKVVAGVVAAELVHMGYHDVLNVSPAALDAALRRAGHAPSDVYDPTVAAELARDLGADVTVTGELLHYGTQREQNASKIILLAGSGQTRTTHWVSLGLRIVPAGEPRVIYAGAGTAGAAEGYNPAAREACRQALAALKRFLDRQKR